jgi:ligand-binding SRPBCC domain-containing protein
MHNPPHEPRFLRRRQWSMFVARPIDRVFAFFADAANLERITPPWLRFDIVTPIPIAMGPGTLIDYRLRVRGLPIRWRTRISVWEPPHRFVDEQLRGPYRLWHHEHLFEPHEGGTVCRDVVRYVPPGRWLAPLIDRLFVRRDVDRIFAYRAYRLGELLTEAPPAGPAAPSPFAATEHAR